MSSTAARWVLLALLGGCAEDDLPRGPAAIPRPDGRVVAEVSGDSITATALANVASRQRLSIDEARDRLVRDALLAAAARAELPASQVRDLQSRVLARAVLRDLWRTALEQPISEAELAEATAQLWMRYDRPEGRRTAHAVVMASPSDPAEKRSAARALAERLRAALEPAAAEAVATTPPARSQEQAFAASAGGDDPAFPIFEKAAKDFPHDAELEVRVEALPAIAADGRALVNGAPPEASFVEPYARAAFTLSRRGELSAIVETDFGYHVILLLETTPPTRLSAAERMKALEGDILRVRGKRRQRELVAALTESASVELAPNHEALLATVNVRQAPAAPAPPAGP
jgi:peptidyl-prolyl cis-trans isomerase C